MNYQLTLDILQSGIRFAVPILIAAQGELVLQRAGAINIGIEGMMLIGAFAAMAAAYSAQTFLHLTAATPYLGAAAGMAAGAAASLIFVWFALHRRGDQIVVGAGINIFALGLTGLFNRRIFGRIGEGLTVPVFRDLPVPFTGAFRVNHEPFRVNPLVYAAITLTIAVWVFLYRTRAGLAVRAMGEHPRAADAAGIRVTATRSRAALFGGMCAGLAGSALTLYHANTFIEGMTVGKGFIAIAVVVFGRWRPLPIAAAALFFGVTEAASIRLPASGAAGAVPGLGAIPYQFFAMLPYVLTLIALAVTAGKGNGPAALGKAYVRE